MSRRERRRMRNEATTKAEAVAEQENARPGIEWPTHSYGLRRDTREPWTFHVVRVEGDSEEVISRAPEERLVALAHLYDAIERDAWGAE